MLMDLASGRVITRSRVTEVPVTNAVIHAVERLAAKDGIKTLKILDRNKRLLNPDIWFAGVGPRNRNQHQHDDTDSESEDDDDSDPDDLPDTDSIHSSDSESEDDDELEGYEPVDTDELDEILADARHGMRFVSENHDDNNEAAIDADGPEMDMDVASVGVPISEDDEPTTNNPAPDPEEVSVSLRRSERAVERPVKYSATQAKRNNECHVTYTSDRAHLIAQLMLQISDKVAKRGASFAQQYMLKRGLQKWGDKAGDAAQKELDQLHRRNCFTPIDMESLTPTEKKRAQEALMFVTEKRDGTIKGRMVYNGKPTRDWLSKEDSSSPTVSLESIFLTAALDAKEHRDILTADIPNAFIQTAIPQDMNDNEKIIMKITGKLVELLVELDPKTYQPFVTEENGKRVLYVQVLQALYGMLIAALLWYKQFRGDLEKVGFKFNPYDPCVANRLVERNQQTIRYHVDDVKSSTVDSKVHDAFEVWLNDMYGSITPVKVHRGKVHDYLGMTFDYSQPGKVIVDMKEYVSNMLDEFSVKFQPEDTAPTPARNDLFAAGIGEALNTAEREEFHTFVAKGLFLCKRARPDIHPAIAVLCSRVKDPKRSDWDKLVHMMMYLNGTRDEVLTLSANNELVVKWWVDASFGVHPDLKSHTGAVMSLGTGAVVTLSRKQKLNTRSSTEAELVGADDAMTMVLWTKLFLEAQGYKVQKNVLYQDNKSAMLLEGNGKRSSGQRTRAINIRYFFITDQVEKGNVVVEYCPTDEMVGDFMTKPLQGGTFSYFKSIVLGKDDWIPVTRKNPRARRSVLKTHE
jgi:Reverse transcriptase (RNA-dependent DNA polymerase)